ncbi:hypothetical protein DCCM_4603 [Desulfocucumis palustris]|uniref:Uncharacterized protein n=1 Tax=Desulfocucumis palustris TaxID=1898651 RepID=A0A2L2XHL2_9FIRM|nr:hypothetical protein DCCM_4603 [Desulfocucumis palustris]
MGQRTANSQIAAALCRGAILIYFSGEAIEYITANSGFNNYI